MVVMKIGEINWGNGRIREVRFVTEMETSSVIIVAELYSDLKADYRKRVDIKCESIRSIHIDFDVNELQKNSGIGNIINGEAVDNRLEVSLTKGCLLIMSEKIKVERY